MECRASLNLTKAEISSPFAVGMYAEKFPPVLSAEQAAELLQLPLRTLYDWSHRGLLNGCCRRVGKYLRFYRDRLIHRVFNEGISA